MRKLKLVEILNLVLVSKVVYNRIFLILKVRFSNAIIYL